VAASIQLVTGGAGFIGSHLVDRLVGDGARVRVLDDLSTGAAAYVPDGVELIDGDVADDAALAGAVDGVEVVYHQAALASVARSVQDPAAAINTNVGGTLTLLLAARDGGCRRVVFASSSSVYGDGAPLPQVETMAADPLSPYAVSKLAGEQLCRVFSSIYGLETVALRYFNVFGERQDPASDYAAVIPAFLDALRTGTRPTIYGDGEQSRDFVHVDNVVDANLSAASAPGVHGRVFNVASGKAVTLNQLLATMARLFGADVEPVYAPPRKGEARHTLADIGAAREALGYEVRVSLEEGLERMVRGDVRA
jgi:UDP-glucose 4-epimerase